MIADIFNKKSGEIWVLLTTPLFHRDQKKDLNSVHCDAPELLPISNLITNEHSTLSKTKLIFCYRALIQALHAYLKNDYTQFDAQTTTNCCHGMSLLVHKTINEMSNICVKNIFLELKEKLDQLENGCEQNTNFSSFLNFALPKQILILAQIHILFVIREFDKDRGNWRTVIQKLKKIGPIGTKFCGEIVKKIQFNFSNLISEIYQFCVKKIPESLIINDIPITLWGKYIQNEYIKTDRYGRKYAACLYSMQVTLAHLIHHRAKIAFISDLKCKKGVYKDTYIQLFEGNGSSDFTLLETDSINFSEHKVDEPVIVFGGCTYSDYLDKKSLEFQLTPWFYRFPSLVLACDTFYPQFPLIRDDPEFDSNPISPAERKLNQIIDTHRELKGVSASDPSLFCLTHIYVASLKQVQQTMRKEQNHLPQSIIPEVKRHPLIARDKKIA